MPKKPHNVRITQYFFPETHVRAWEKHDPTGIKNGTQHVVSYKSEEIPSQKNQHGVTVTLETDDEKSENAPYSYKIVAFGLFDPVSSDTEELVDDYRRNVELVAFQVLFGAIREHLASVTARGPWGTFVAGAMNVEPVNKEKVEVPANPGNQ